ncbi:MAG: aminotransferase [Planctomycetota bacterium]|nr:MAG: aminotransferase [Planctomycetota bacterium]
MEPSRRAFLRTFTGSGLLAFAWLKDDWAVHLARAQEAAPSSQPPSVAAGNENFWFHIQQAFDIDRSIINLNNGGVCPSPRVVHEAMKRQLDWANHAPSRHLWEDQDPQVELIRVRLARQFGCDPEELAITRNASESLQIVLNGLDLKAGDEVLTTTQDYPRMLNTLRQRERREGIVLKQLRLPVPIQSADQVIKLFEEGISEKTKAILVCHVVNITGQILPVAEICRMARERGIRTIVDGAHAFAQITYQCADIDCDMYGVSLHKWLTAPIGTGFLYVRKELIKSLWPLQAAPIEKDDNIRKFEEIGTHPTAPRLAIGEALTFYQGIGPARKEARLRWLRDYWAQRLSKYERVRFHTNLDPAHSCAIATFGIEGIAPNDLAQRLWRQHKIIVTPIVHEDFQGIRVTPNVYSTTQELDIFCDAIGDLIEKGLPEKEPAAQPAVTQPATSAPASAPAS